MAILDSKWVFSDAQTLAGISGSNCSNSTNVIDMGDATQQMGRGTPLWLNIVVNTGFTGAAASTLVAALNHSADGTTWASKLIFASITASAAATAGVVVAQVALPQESLNRYLQLSYLRALGLSSGKVDAWIGLDTPRTPQTSTTYGAVSGE